MPSATTLVVTLGKFRLQFFNFILFFKIKDKSCSTGYAKEK